MKAAGARAATGEGTKSRIVHLAMNLASRQGLESLSIGDLAKELGMSKSGLFAHFGSKEELQIAAIAAAESVFSAAIVAPAEDVPAGLARLRAYLENYLNYLEDGIFPGGCFFAAAAAEYDDRPGRVRDRIALSMVKWGHLLIGQAQIAQSKGELQPGVDPSQLVFELKAYTHEANFNRRLLDDNHSVGQGLHALREKLFSVASKSGRVALKS